MEGDPSNAFGPALARGGIIALMPDAIGFEDRRRSGRGTAPREDEDRLAYLNEMAHRLVSGRLLMSAVVADAAAAGTGIELAQVIPGILHVADVDDVVALIAPRPLLLVSATEDEYSRDADDVERTAAPAYTRLGAAGALRHTRFEGAHALTPERFEHIMAWVNSQAHAPAA